MNGGIHQFSSADQQDVFRIAELLPAQATELLGGSYYIPASFPLRDKSLVSGFQAVVKDDIQDPKNGKPNRQPARSVWLTTFGKDGAREITVRILGSYMRFEDPAVECYGSMLTTEKKGPYCFYGAEFFIEGGEVSGSITLVRRKWEVVERSDRQRYTGGRGFVRMMYNMSPTFRDAIYECEFLPHRTLAEPDTTTRWKPLRGLRLEGTVLQAIDPDTVLDPLQALLACLDPNPETLRAFVFR